MDGGTTYGARALDEPGLPRPVVLVTGGSSGIGLELARGFAARGHDVVLAARDAGRLAAAASLIAAESPATVDTLACDLTSPGEAARLLEVLHQAGAYPDVLVNCAGTAVFGPFASNDPQRACASLQLNIMAATELMQACLPGMLERGRGGVLNVASLAGTLPMPHFAVYAASKSYLISLTRAVAAETRRSGVTVSVLQPGIVDTAFFARNLQAERGNMALLPSLSAAVVARTGINGFLAGHTVITPGMLGHLCRLATAVLPAGILARLAGFVLAPPAGRPPKHAPAPADSPNALPVR